MISKRLLAFAGVTLALIAAGCGGSDESADQSVPDQSGQISRAKEKERERQNRVEAQRKKAAVEINSILAGLPGQAGLVIGSPGSGGSDLSGGSISTGDAWSTIKVPIAERVLEDAGGPNRITSAQADEITRAITLSDNDAAAALFAGLEAEHGGLEGATGAVNEMLLHAGDRETVVSTQGRDGFSTYGQTDWSLNNQFKYMAALAGGCISKGANQSYLLDQMAAVGGSDTFGFGAAGFPASWKGGWGPDPDGKYLVRQMGVMEVDGKPIVIAMAARPDDGSFETGATMLSDIARATASRLAGFVSAPSGC